MARVRYIVLIDDQWWLINESFAGGPLGKPPWRLLRKYLLEKDQGFLLPPASGVSFYTLHIEGHTRSRWKFSLADIKKIFWRSDLCSKISHVPWNVLLIHSLLTGHILHSFGKCFCTSVIVVNQANGLTLSCDTLWWEIDCTVGVAPNDSGLGSDLITSGAVVVVAEDSTDVVVSPFLDVATLFNWRTPAWVNCASCCDVKINGFDGGVGSEKLNLHMLNKKA